MKMTRERKMRRVNEKCLFYTLPKCASQVPQLSTSKLVAALPEVPTEELFRLAAVILYV
jgi:hypothetical protein